MYDLKILIRKSDMARSIITRRPILGVEVGTVVSNCVQNGIFWTVNLAKWNSLTKWSCTWFALFRRKFLYIYIFHTHIKKQLPQDCPRHVHPTDPPTQKKETLLKIIDLVTLTWREHMITKLHDNVEEQQ